MVSGSSLPSSLRRSPKPRGALHRVTGQPFPWCGSGRFWWSGGGRTNIGAWAGGAAATALGEDSEASGAVSPGLRSSRRLLSLLLSLFLFFLSSSSFGGENPGLSPGRESSSRGRWRRKVIDYLAQPLQPVPNQEARTSFLRWAMVESSLDSAQPTAVPSSCPYSSALFSFPAL